MNKLMTCLAVFVAVLFGNFAYSDDFKFTSLTVSAGEDPISSGITGIVDMDKGSNTFQLAVQHEQAWIVAGKRLKPGKAEIVVAGSIGHFQGSPWGGPYFTAKLPLAKNISVSTLQWPAAFVWEPRDWKTENDGVKNPEKLYIGYLGSIKLDIGRFALVYSWLDYLDEKFNVLPGVSYTQRIRKDFKVAGSATWNTNKKKWLFYVGGTYDFKQK